MKLNLRLTFRGGFEVVILQDGIQAELAEVEVEVESEISPGVAARRQD